MSSGKGGDSQGALTGYDYYASFAGLLGIGPADALVEIIVDTKSVFKPETPVARSGAANPYVINAANGTIYFYWGDADQTLTDPVMTAAGYEQPNYRGRVLIVFENYLCGFERLSVPDVSVVYRRKPQQSAITDSMIGTRANPLAAIAEVLTHPQHGAALPAARLDSSFATIAAALDTEGDARAVDVVLTSQVTPLEFIQDMNSYGGTWLRWSPSGTVVAGRYLRLGEAVPESLPTITEHDMTTPLELTPQGWDNLDDRVLLNYTDAVNSYSERHVRYDTPEGRDWAETAQEATADRPWCSTGTQATALAVEIGVRQSTPWHQLAFTLRESRVFALGLQPGDLFNLTYAPQPFSALCRITKMSGWADGGSEVSIKAETERLLSDAFSTSSLDTITASQDEDITALPFTDILLASSELVGGDRFSVLILASRSQGNISGARVWWRSYASSDFTVLGDLQVFACPVQLEDDYADTEALTDTTGNLLISQRGTPIETITSFEAAPVADDIANDTTLLVLMKSTGVYEILTIASIESPTSGVYPLHVNRARLGTSRLSFVDGDVGYIIRRADLALFRALAFPVIASGSTSDDRTIITRCQPFTARGVLDLADAANDSVVMGFVESATAVGLRPQVAAVNINVAPYFSTNLIYFQTATAGADIYWSLSSFTDLYDSGVNLFLQNIYYPTGTTIYARAYRPDLEPSDLATFVIP